MSVHQQIIDAARRLRDEVDALSFGEPVTHVYNPLRYAWKAHQAYLSRVSSAGVRVVFLGMNPGPWGMAQTGVPFGEIEAVRDWIGIDMPVGRPLHEHAKRPITGFDCRRSEVSGKRLWGLFRDRCETADAFFAEHFVCNYCPLVFMEASARKPHARQTSGRGAQTARRGLRSTLADSVSGPTSAVRDRRRGVCRGLPAPRGGSGLLRGDGGPNLASQSRIAGRQQGLGGQGDAAAGRCGRFGSDVALPDIRIIVAEERTEL